MSKPKLYKCVPCVQVFVGRTKYDEHLRYHKRSELPAEREARKLNAPPPPPVAPRKMRNDAPTLW